MPETQEPGPLVPCPVPVLAGLLPSPCLLAPEPRTSAQTKLTARPGGWCSSVPFLPSSLHWGGFAEEKGLRLPPAVQYSGSKCEVRRGCRWKQRRTGWVGEERKSQRAERRTRGHGLMPTPSTDAET